MKRKRKIKKSSIFVVIVVLLILCGGFVGGAFVLKTMQASYEMRIDSLETQIASNTKNVYVSAVDIKYGDIIMEDMLIKESQLLSYPADLFTQADIGKVAKLSVPSGTIMLSAMCEEELKGLTEREVEFTCFYVSQNVEVGDYIDVRIRYQNGEDFVILPKKRVERLSLTNATCFLMVDEMELQMIASAIVDVTEYNAVMYSNVYPQPEIQEAAVSTYPVRNETNSLLAELSVSHGVEYVDTAEKRLALEERLLDSSEDGTIVDISNLKGYEGSDVSNTNGNGNNISSDYEAGVENNDAINPQ